MLRGRASLALLATSSCIKLASFHPGDGSGSASGDANADAAPPGECGNGGSNAASATMSGTAICAAGPGYALRLPASGFRFPDQFRIGSTDILGTSSACNEEDGLGISLYPLPRIAASSPAVTSPMANASILLPGPVVAKVSINWMFEPANTCATGMFTGTTQLTLFPDGRMMRYDKLAQPATSSYAMCDPCASGAQHFALRSYIAFDPTNLMLTDSAGVGFQPGTGAGMQAPQLSCASASNWALAIAQLAQGTARETTGAHATALTYDFDTTSAMLTSTTSSTVTAYQIGSAGTCSELTQRISEFQMASGSLPNVHVDEGGGNSTDVPPQLDGIYGGYDGTSAGLPLIGNPTSVVLSAISIPPGWALWLTQQIASTSRAPDSYMVQNGSYGGIVWFRDGLSGSDSITVNLQ